MPDGSGGDRLLMLMLMLVEIIVVQHVIATRTGHYIILTPGGVSGWNSKTVASMRRNAVPKTVGLIRLSLRLRLRRCAMPPGGVIGWSC